MIMFPKWLKEAPLTAEHIKKKVEHHDFPEGMRTTISGGVKEKLIFPLHLFLF